MSSYILLNLHTHYIVDVYQIPKLCSCILPVCTMYTGFPYNIHHIHRLTTLNQLCLKKYTGIHPSTFKATETKQNGVRQTGTAWPYRNIRHFLGTYLYMVHYCHVMLMFLVCEKVVTFYGNAVQLFHCSHSPSFIINTLTV